MGRYHKVALLGASAFVGAVFTIAGAGCKQSGAPKTAANPTERAGAPAEAAAPVSSKPVSDAQPNEMGRVPMLEYHQITSKEARWARTPANFRKDLELLYKNGFRAVSLRDYVTGSMNLPRGASPVVFTFDDADPGQFRYIEKNGKQEIDPDCAVGMLEEFNRKHPDFGLKATFYVLPSGFGQGQYVKQKFQYIAQRGMELGNHTYDHYALRKLTGAAAQEQMGKGVRMIQEAVPNHDVFSIALPHGIFPKEKALARAGSWSGVHYNHRAVMLVGSAPALSPFSAKFDAYNIPRVQVTDSLPSHEQAFTFSAQWKSLMKPGRRYVSDGDPNTITVPADAKADVSPAKAKGKTVKAL